MARLQTEPIDVVGVLDEVRSDGDGALGVFVGTVRDHHHGKAVSFLEYHAYDAMAERQLAGIEDEARRRFELGAVLIVHRTGRLAIGDASVVIAAAAPHRAAALDACRFAIDTLKRRAPIWKKEHFEDGEVLWVEDGR